MAMEFKKYVHVSTIFMPLQNFCLDKTKQFKYYGPILLKF